MARPRVLIPERKLRAGVARLAAELERGARGRPLTLVVALDGAFVFAADLARRLRVPVRFAFVSLSSYGAGTRSTGRIRWRLRPEASLRGRDLVVVEDIVDTGRSAAALLAALRKLRPRSLKFCALLRKKARMVIDVPLDHVGFDIPDRFVVGYGLDAAGAWRELPYVGVVG